MPAPDLVQAFIAHTRTLTATNTMSKGQISGRVKTKGAKNDPTGWVMPDFAIVYRKVPGPTLRRYGKLPQHGQPIQVEWYGPNELEAEHLFETWDSDFFPKANNVAQGFVAAGCAIESLEEMSAPASGTAPDTAWPRMVGIYFVRWWEPAP